MYLQRKTQIVVVSADPVVVINKMCEFLGDPHPAAGHRHSIELDIPPINDCYINDGLWFDYDYSTNTLWWMNDGHPDNAAVIVYHK